jgi:flagellar hook-length control protein FliK
VATTVGETEPHVAVSTTPQAVQQLARDAAALQPQVAPGRVNGQVFHQADEALQTSLPSAAELGLRRLSADQSLATRDAEAPVQMQLADPVVSPVREKVVDSVIGTRPDVQDAANDRLLSPLRLAAVANDVRGDALAPANTLAHASLVTGMTATATGDALAPHQLPAGTLSLKAPDWDQRMGSNVAFMLKENVSTARIHMKPEELGSMSVQVSVQSDRLSVTLAAANPMTRDALEASLPRLREQFSALGFSDVDVNVGDSGQSGRDPRGMDERNGTPENNGYYLSSTGSDTQEVAPVSERVVIQRGLLDTFA